MSLFSLQVYAVKLNAKMVKDRTKCAISAELLHNQIKRVKTNVLGGEFLIVYSF